MAEPVGKTLDGRFVAERRGELGTLSRRQLLAIFARLPGRSTTQAKRTWLSSTALIDIIIWTEAQGQ
jgi:hypothetical protein